MLGGLSNYLVSRVTFLSPIADSLMEGTFLASPRIWITMLPTQAFSKETVAGLTDEERTSSREETQLGNLGAFLSAQVPAPQETGNVPLMWSDLPL